MRKSTFILTVVFCVLIGSKSISQINDGKYIEQEEFLILKSDSIAFNLKYGKGIVQDLKGSGNYKIINNFLLVKTIPYQAKSHHAESKNCSGNVEITVNDLKGKPIIGANIEVLDNSGNLLFGVLSKEEGRALIKRTNAMSKIVVSYLLFHKYTFNLSPNTNYHVFLDQERVENQTMAFKINDITNHGIELTLLSTNFEAQENISKELEKLYSEQKNCTRKINLTKAN